MDFIFADTETTGAKEGATVCEVGWFRTDENFKILDQVESLIDPEQMISHSASGIHGLVNADCVDSPTLQEFFTEDDPSCHGKLLDAAVVIGHRIGFDMRFLAPYFTVPPIEICTLRWARYLYPDCDDHKLQTLLYALDLPKSKGAHRVMADVWSAYYLCRHICERTGMTLPQLALASQEPMELAIFSVGNKHRGEPFGDVPKSYMQWCQREMKDLDMDMSYTLALHLNKKNKK